jgi:hypothetical protein
VTGLWPELGRLQRRRTRAARLCGGGRRNGGFGGSAAKARWPEAWVSMVGVCASANGLRGAGEVSSRELGAGTAMAAWTAACPRRNAAVPVFIDARERRVFEAKEHREVGDPDGLGVRAAGLGRCARREENQCCGGHVARGPSRCPARGAARGVRG